MDRPLSGVDPAAVPATLVAHLDSWLGRWPPAGPLDVVGSAGRERPGWDGTVYPAVAVAGAGGIVLSVPPNRVAAVSALVHRGPPRGVLDELGPAVGRDSLQSAHRVFRWCTEPVPWPDAGTWLPAADPHVPSWMRPFGGEVLVALDGSGDFLGGVGIKRHDRWSGELAVVTAQRARGRGLGRRLVAQAARRVLDEGAVPTYLHGPENVASARVAAAVGFADRGWTAVLALAPDPLRVRLRRLAGHG
jgi:GNAT superfamily N-acetyltransferase